TVWNGIDYQNLKFLDKVSARKTILSRLNPIPYTPNPHTPWIGSLGRLVKEKDYATFIQAASLVPNPHVFFFIIGNGYEEKSLTAQITGLKLQNRFFLVPSLKEASSYLSAFDIFTLTSRKEGLPYSLLEAMAEGLP